MDVKICPMHFLFRIVRHKERHYRRFYGHLFCVMRLYKGTRKSGRAGTEFDVSELGEDINIVRRNKRKQLGGKKMMYN